MRISIIAALAVAVGAAIVLQKSRIADESRAASTSPSRAEAALPRLLDLGADKCIPCKLMAPILDELRREHAHLFAVEFIDVWKNTSAAKKYGVEVIPTQIFFDAQGKERFRHTGFFGKEDILNKWKELGINLTTGAQNAIVREVPLSADVRPADAVCFLCDGDVNARTRTIVKGQADQRILCSPHCYFIYFSSIVGADSNAEDAKVSVADWSGGNAIAASAATYLYGMDARGRATIKAFADKNAATREQQTRPGNLVTWDVLRSKELATRCAFCDRAVYPEDACAVRFGATRGYGCCTHCSMGVAARLKQDIEVEARDALTGELIRVTTLGGKVASLEPATAVAWFGQNKSTDGNWVSAGCFKQGFFINARSLQKWLDARPTMTGRQITIAQALADKMKLSPEQIAKACKLGECK